MKAKFYVTTVTRMKDSEVLSLIAVCSDKLGSEGLSEDNTFFKWTPKGSLEMTVTNPALFGKFNPGDTYYLDFTLAPTPAV